MHGTSGKRRTLAIVPARGGSKGLPRKNVKMLLGKPLVAWSVVQAKNCPSIDKVIVSTEDADIADVARKNGADMPFMRPKKLATDGAKMMDVVLHVLASYEDRGESFDRVVLLEPTSPLRKRGDLENALSALTADRRADSIISLGEVHLESPYVMKGIEKGFVRPFLNEGKKFHQRQQMPKVYFPYGVVYASDTEALKRTGEFYRDGTMPYLIERWQNYEIDDGYDFACVEAIMKAKMKEGMI